MVDVAHTRSIIEEMRTRLLDLSGSNRLLNFRASSTNCLRIVDELPDQLFAGLLAGKSFTFVPVPEPTERDIVRWHEQRTAAPRASVDPATLAPPKPEEWAQQFGTDVSFELPLDQGDPLERHHSDWQIQTLLYPAQMETRLRKLRSDASTAVEETGTNFLHLAFGFLDWKDGDGAGAKGSLAPLILVPVEITQKRSPAGHLVYDLSWSGEDLQPNLSLQKKLREEFGLDLKDFDEGLTPERYFHAVRELVRPREGWLVRRFATLSLFQFGKLLIYRDLDPRSWPEGGEPALHPVIRHITSGASGGGIGFEDPAPAEARTLDLDLDLVERADSSQAGAIHAALGGTHLVIQGPPGTGKSQTITNLIAGALSAGRTVLFVSEKLAALEVVRHRLDALGLGDFVLELHSNKTRKAALIDDLRHRLDAGASFRRTQSFASTIEGLARDRDRVQAIHAALGQRVGALGIPASKVFFEAGRLRRRLPDPHTVGLTVSSDEIGGMTPAQMTAGGTSLESFLKVAGPLFEAGQTLADHPFGGLSSARLLGAPDREEVLALLAAWQDGLRRLSGRLADSAGRSGIDVPSSRRAAESLAALHDRRDAVEESLQAAGRMGDLPGQIAAMFDLTQEPESRQAALAGTILDLATHRPPDLQRFSAGLLSDRSDESRRSDIAATLAILSQTRKDLGQELDIEAAVSRRPGRLEEIADTLSGGGLLRWFRPSWRAARQEALALGRSSSKLGEMPERLRRAARLQTDERQLLADLDLLRLAGSAPVSDIEVARRSLDQLGAGRAYAERVEALFGRGLSKEARLTRALLALSPGDAADLASAARTEEGVALRTVGERLSHLLKPGAHPHATSTREAILDALGAGPAAAAVASMTVEERSGYVAVLGEIALALDEEKAAAQAFATRTGLDPAFWPIGDDDLERLALRATRASNAAHRLTEWLEIDRHLRRIDMPLARQILQAVVARRIDHRSARDHFDFAIMDGLARLAIARTPLLHDLGQSEIDDARRRYAEQDERVMDLRAIEIAAQLARRPVPEGQSGARVSDLTDLQLLKREMAKKTKHIPIRQLVQRAGGALQALKPCFMMGPLSVAQYLKPGGLRFDLVIFDEASQVRPEEALGALARGDQAVIVGDSKQLPPTDFFQRTGDGGEDGAIAAGAESILEVAEIRLPTRSLRWHYRSQHPDLIAFSNHAFYNGDLVLYPSPTQTSEDLGIRFQHVPEGAFRDGTNPAEAEAVASAVLDHLERYPGDSLGVVAMNVKQRDLILERLERLSADGRGGVDAAEALDSLQERFFVKNLENVQGDERDGIIISMTYGPPAPGERVAQAFGPITGDNGWRRLNVLFSRAKKRMHVVSSMREGDVTPGEDARRGPRALKSFLHFAETGRLDRTRATPGPSGRDPDSDFEVAVMEGLSAAGHVCVPQVGSSGFFIDIGVVDPQDPQRFLLGIECDGASYHSTLSARDRDRLRQDILESKGWTIERVWSTDWFRDPDRELARLLGRIRAIEDGRRRPPGTGSADRGEEVPASPPPAEASRTELHPISTGEGSPDAAAPARPDVEPATPAASKPTRSSARQAVLFEPAARDPLNPSLERSSPKAPPKAPKTIADASITQEEARLLLIELRERIAADHPAYDRATSVLRKSMIGELLAKRPLDETEFRDRIRPDLRLETKGSELKEHGEAIFDILERVR
ncbi:hypothetical protein ASG43_10800 [Aureimonas sp. Leaf454]|uniref:DUF4011 domain-containing protein n=1 Tax=Aureimonas sp. Leaf454 TaxID=1736381 RepID=UPI0006F9D4F8|nr:DUF4011 domain-containing protein [Aureimonas sp. Leaf454]KQT47560.1 hypothetical protein ASG43_10800 [Aureimonas sp. Leaf454]